MGGGRAGETRGGTLAGGWRDNVPIKTSRAIPNPWGSRRAIFVKVSDVREEQEK